MHLYNHRCMFDYCFFFIWQGMQLHSYQLDTQRIYRDLSQFHNDDQFNRATFLFPTRRIEDVYTLHTYFSRVSVEFDTRYMILWHCLQYLSNDHLCVYTYIVAFGRDSPGEHTPQPWRLAHFERHAAQRHIGGALATGRSRVGGARDAPRHIAVDAAQRNAPAHAGPRAKCAPAVADRCGRLAGER